MQKCTCSYPVRRERLIFTNEGSPQKVKNDIMQGATLSAQATPRCDGIHVSNESTRKVQTNN